MPVLLSFVFLLLFFFNFQRNTVKCCIYDIWRYQDKYEYFNAWVIRHIFVRDSLQSLKNRFTSATFWVLFFGGDFLFFIFFGFVLFWFCVYVCVRVFFCFFFLFFCVGVIFRSSLLSVMQCGCVLVFESQTPWSCCSLSWSAWELRDFECFEISFLPVHVYLEQADILQWTLQVHFCFTH